LERNKQTSSPARSSPSLLLPLCVLSFFAILRVFSKRQVSQRNESSNSTNQTDHNRGDIPITTTKAETSTIETRDADDKIDGDKERNWEKITALSQIGIGVITAGLLIVNIGLIQSTRKSTDTADKSLKLAYRPRIEVRGITAEPTLIQEHFRSTVDVVNYAPITARNVRIYRFDAITTKEQAHILAYEELTDQPKTILANSQNANFAFPSHTTVTGEQWRDIGLGKLVGIVSILIVYEDDFSIPHHAEYCTFFGLPSNGPPCPWDMQNN
jgi:hypothetical protein